MALARPLSYEIEIEVPRSSARSNAVDNSNRQTSRGQVAHTQVVPRRKLRLVSVFLLGLLVWAAVVGTALLLVNRWALVAQTGFAITRTREELVRLEIENQALQAEASRLQSLASIEERALALGMGRPTQIQQVAADPSAVASRPPLEEIAAIKPAQARSLWESVRATATSLFHDGKGVVARLRVEPNRASAASP
jgi:cell division protein FtsB